jgi:8-oxo-dGTP diphosphatase
MRMHDNMPYMPIIATLGYVLSADRQHVLLIHRNTRPNDPHYGKFNGLGGKLQPDEDILSCLRREIQEEAGIRCQQILLAGTISWPGFGVKGEHWFGFIFRVEAWSGDVLTQNSEGTLSWVRIDQMLHLPLWEGDHYFLPLVFADPLRVFHGVMPYHQGKPLSWHYQLA